MNDALEKALKALYEKVEEEEFNIGFTKELSHRALWEIYLERAPSRTDNPTFFVSAVVTCTMVICENRDGYRFRRGNHVSPIISGIMYCTSCTAYLEIRKYSSSLGDSTAESDIVSMMSLNAKVGLSVFTYIRSICATVRPEETEMHLYHTCREHAKCVLLEGKGLSASQIGRAVREMHQKICTILFGYLMRGVPFLDIFRESCDALVDDDSNETVGYWALDNLWNSAFIRMCNNWVASSVLSEMTVPLMKR